MTNYRLRDFDFDVGNLFEYESPGPYSARPVAKASYVLIKGFKPGSVKPPANTYNCILQRVAHLLVASQQIKMPMSEMALMGYPDAPGTDEVTRNLAFNRAAKVRKILQDKMNSIVPGSAGRVTFSIYVNNAPGAGVTRAVDVLLPMTCQTFFADYDQQSFSQCMIGMEANPAISVAKREERKYNRFFIVQELQARLAKRAAKALEIKVMPATSAPVSAAGEGVVKTGMNDLSAMQLALFRKYFPKGPDFAPESLMNCMLKFANGQLRSPHDDFETDGNEGRKTYGVGEPDGPHVFLFAEFALLCIDWKIPDAKLWEKALPAMVAAQEVFMHVYRKKPTSSPPPLDSSLPTTPVRRATHSLEDFGAQNFKQTGDQTTGVGQSSAARLDLVTAKYKKLVTPDELREAMKLNLLRAQTLT